MGVLFQLPELFHVKRLVPAHVNQDFDASIKLEQRLRCHRVGQGALEGAEAEHG